jgi:hypothetical protein
MSRIHALNEKQQQAEANAGKVSAALVEWGDEKATKPLADIAAQEQVVASSEQELGRAQTHSAKTVAEAKQASNWFDQILSGVVALVGSQKLGDLPPETTFDKNNRYGFADTLASLLEKYGAHGVWLAKAVIHAKEACLSSMEKVKHVAKEVATAETSYEVAVRKLINLTQQAETLLRENVPHDSKVLAHFKRKSSAKKSAKKESEESENSADEAKKDSKSETNSKSSSTSSSPPGSSTTSPN